MRSAIRRYIPACLNPIRINVRLISPIHFNSTPHPRLRPLSDLFPQLFGPLRPPKESLPFSSSPPKFL
jgi:hypothetical protein